MVNSCPEERKMFRITPMHYVIYDEAHMLKNMSTQRYDNLLKIKVYIYTNTSDPSRLRSGKSVAAGVFSQ